MEGVKGEKNKQGCGCCRKEERDESSRVSNVKVKFVKRITNFDDNIEHEKSCNVFLKMSILK